MKVNVVKFIIIALFASSVSLMEGGGVERKLSLGLVRSLFALSIGDNILSFSHNRRASGARD